MGLNALETHCLYADYVVINNLRIDKLLLSLRPLAKKITYVTDEKFEEIYRNNLSDCTLGGRCDIIRPDVRQGQRNCNFCGRQSADDGSRSSCGAGSWCDYNSRR